MSLAILWERTWPWLGALAITVFWYWVGGPFPKTPDTLFGTAATVASVFASFLGVAEAIIIGLKGSASYKVLEKAGYTSLLFGYLRSGILSAVTFATLSIVGFFIADDVKIDGYLVAHVFAAIWITVGGASVLTFARISNILFKLLHQP
ncbi:hypothetical protein BFX40_28995 [Mesorhizobium sp. SEMIA 3007]|uniref:hypothetical protein n=1 Tax=Mesorhizobium sp. SEMIA 3007 TaxID=1862350 RepID=UPI00083CB827|nr:hypothetical protein [Mesorhizobium sp. SEMIA 3007]ODA96488.1 hypothetical protein BFX40_28995 [Mesorhizobium sp. SEMIA 3007]